MNDNNIEQTNMNSIAVSCENKRLDSTSTGYAIRSIAYAKAGKSVFNFRFVVCAILSAWLIAVPDSIRADIKLPAIISNNMVLQQKSAVPLWGWAKDGETIRINVSWSCNVLETVTDSNGFWTAKIDTPQSGGPYELKFIDGNDVCKIENVLIGEVWLCSGQSNMEMPVAKGVRGYGGVDNYKQEIAEGNYPGIRLFFVARNTSQEPQSDCTGQWTVCSPKTVGSFSAVAYFFGRELHKTLKVPIGLIDSSWGGTPAEAWTSRRTLESDPDFKAILTRYDEAVRKYPQAKKEYERKLQEWADSNGVSPKPQPPVAPEHHHQAPAGLFNAMISPLIPYRIKGVIWYQGESNRTRAYQYRKLFPAMIANWRNAWGQGEFPFYYVQIAPFNYSILYTPPSKENECFCPELQEAQFKTLSVPNTGMVVTTDISDLNDIHPKNKVEVGRRLALWALAKNYGKTNIVYSGPLYKSMDIEDAKIRISFDNVGSGLMVKGSQLSWFTISGEDRQFVPANAVIDGNEVVVWSEQVKKPVAVRFGWNMVAQPNLFNKEGLPASPFRTDDWPGFTFDKR